MHEEKEYIYFGDIISQLLSTKQFKLITISGKKQKTRKGKCKDQATKCDTNYEMGMLPLSDFHSLQKYFR